MKRNIIQEMIAFIKKGNTEKAIEKLEENLFESSTHTNDLAMLMSRFNILKKESITNTLSYEVYHKETAAVNSSLLNLIDNIKQDELEYDSILIYNKDILNEVESFYASITENINDLDILFDKTPSLNYNSNQYRSVLILHKNSDIFWQSNSALELVHKKVESSEKIINVILPSGNKNIIPDFLRKFETITLSSIFDDIALHNIRKIIRGNLVPIYKNRKYDSNSFLPIGYEADVEKIIQLLIGESLYASKDVAVRELIQNSFDAIERRNAVLTMQSPIIEVKIYNSYFEVHDNGEGMNAKLLRESFSIIGKSFSKEYNLQNFENDKRKKLIGQFGIGFISSFIIAKKIEISTKYSNEPQINLTVKKIGEPFEYHEKSQFGRDSEEIGTSIRITLKDEFLGLDLIKAVQEYCRHIPYLVLTHELEKIKLIDSWNTEDAIATIFSKTSSMVLQLGLKPVGEKLVASNNGFYITNIPESIIPEDFPDIICGEINLVPGAVDLNISRDKIMNNAKSQFIKEVISSNVKPLFLKVLNLPDEKMRETVLPYIQFFLQNLSDKKPTVFGFTKFELYDIILCTWKFFFRKSFYTLNEIVEVLNNEKIDRAYYIHRRYISKDSNNYRYILTIVH